MTDILLQANFFDQGTKDSPACTGWLHPIECLQGVARPDEIDPRVPLLFDCNRPTLLIE